MKRGSSMGKHKGLLISIAAVVLVGAVGIFLAQKFHAGQSESFTKSGYVIEANEQAESVRYAFSEGTSYREKYPNAFAFDDTTGAKVEIGKESFVHYDDDSVSALTDGVLMNLADLNHNGSINHYRIGANMLMEKQANTYQLETLQGSMKIEEGIWKISDTRYLLFASNIDVVFDETDSRSAGTFVEINYIDEGVIQIVTQENVWQTVSPQAYAKTANGVELKLFDQVVVNGEFKMTLNKLVISSDENIVLSPLEKKNQEVPTFDIKTEDGTDGSSGVSGTAGENGSNGTKGNSGTSGSNGQIGSEGTDGNDGTSGKNGTSGVSGTDGGSGKNGSTGKPGQSGTDAGQESSMKTAIPSFVIKDWTVDATSVKGTATITDENAMLTADDASIVIYEAGSGEEIKCLNEDGGEGFNVQGESVSFQSDDTVTPLKPDTEYRLVIKAKYEMNGKIYDREFISRVFYTDSLGVFMDKDSVSTNSFVLQIDKKSYSKATSANIYVLTSEQAKSFNVDSSNDYIMQTVSFGEGESYELEFKEEDYPSITSNEKFVVRMVVSANSKTYLSQQALNITTLKKTPTLSDQLYSIRNKPSNAFELYSGAIEDSDHAIIDQYYEIYSVEDGAVQDLVKSIQITAGNGLEAMMLYLDGETIKSGATYRFRLVTLYNDNEKIIEVKSNFSDEFRMTKSSLPALSFEKGTVNYDSISGQLIISLNESTLEISQTKPLIVNIDCEGIYKDTITITSNKDAAIASINPSEIRINVGLNGLKQDEIYRFRVSGYVDLHDDYGTQNIVIGNVVQSTLKTTTIAAEWTNNDNSAYSVAKVLKLTAQDKTSWNDIDASYDANSLSKIEIELYKGSGTSKVFMNSITFEDRDSDDRTSTLVNDFIKNGKEISEVNFGYQPNALTEPVYTMKLNAVYDYTALSSYKDENNIGKYKNEYEVVTGTKEVVITKTNQPPVLPDISTIDSQITATPIYNKEAGRFGKTVDTSLSDNTIIGYTVEPNYENYAKLASEIYFYAFESEEYNTMVKSKENPIFDGSKLRTDGKWLFNKQYDVLRTSTSMPKMALFFGTGTDTTYGGYQVAYTDSMVRGFKYTFAYAVKYNDNATDRLYPYEHPMYRSIAAAYPDIPYVLNSGTKDAPKAEPTFYIYPLSSTFTEDANSTKNKMALKFKYYYIDTDRTISKDSTSFILNRKQAIINVDQKTWGEVLFNDIVSTDLVNGQVIASINRNLYNKDYGESSTKNVTTIPIDLTNTFNKDKVNQLNYEVTSTPDYLNTNKVKITLKDTTTNKYLSTYKTKIAGVNILFYDAEDYSNNVTVYGTLDDKDSITISTAVLEKLVGKNIKTKVSLLYDTNEIGWDVLDAKRKTKEFAMQRIVQSGSTLKLDTYVVYNDNSGAILDNGQTAAGSIFTTKESDWVKMDTLQDTQTIKFQTPLRKDITGEYHVRATDIGVGYSTDDTASLSYVTPKMLNSNDLPVNETSFLLNSIIPSISMDDLYDQGLNNVTLKGINFSGSNAIDLENGKRYVNLQLHNIKTGNNMTQKVAIDDITKNEIKLTGLDINSSYTLTITASVKGSQVNILNSKTTLMFSKEISTKGNVNITAPQFKYEAISYELQRLSFSYKFDQISGFYTQYSILDENDNEIMDQSMMILAEMFIASKPGDIYQTTINQPFELKITKHHLIPNKKYKLKITCYQLDSDGNIMQGQILGESAIPFTIPTTKDPVSFTSLTPESVDGNGLSMSGTFSVSDISKTIMSDYTINDGTEKGSLYLVRVYEQSGENIWTDITPYYISTDGTSLKGFKAGSTFSLKLSTVKPNTNYKVVLYAAIDSNRDGASDNGATILRGSIASMDKSEFERNKDDFIISENIFTTPGADGISLGQTSVQATGGDPAKISFVYKAASNLNSIAKVEYSIISTTGESYSVSETLLNTSKDLFKTKPNVAGYFTLDLPTQLPKAGYYFITINYYKTIDGIRWHTESTYYLYESK